MAHSGEELMRVYTICYYYYFFLICIIHLFCSSSSASSFVFFRLLSLLLLPSSSSCGRLPLFGRRGRLPFFLGRRGGLPFLAGGRLLFRQEVCCLFGRIFFQRGGDIACMCGGCSGGVFVVCH